MTNLQPPSQPPSIPPISSLPEIPLALKHLAPYIQRAAELRAKNPIMYYWCLYYVAKSGVAIKAKQKENRPFLFALMDLLENTKTILKDNDAVNDEAGSAYISNFALRVFKMADDEDRRGASSKSTAKKFLAAANFLELLSVFDVHDQAENEEKIRYAKWKAADIAKAFREGRRPTPGPAGSTVDPSSPLPQNSASGTLSPPVVGDSVFGSIPPSIEASPLIQPSSLPLPVSPSPGASPPLAPHQNPTPVSSPPFRARPLTNTSPERHSSSGEDNRNGFSTPSTLRVSAKDTVGVSPGAWSTLATPGQDPDDSARAALRAFTFSNSPVIAAPRFTDHASPSPSDRRPPAQAQETEHDVAADDEGADSDTDTEDAGARLSAANRQDSWSSTLAHRGGDTAPPSRHGSWSAGPSPIDGEFRQSMSRQGTLSGIPEVPFDSPHPAGAPTIVSAQGAWVSDHIDQIFPLPSFPPPTRKVHFTPSVIGGMSTIDGSVASSSPASVANIPLPPSTDSTDSAADDDDDGRVTVHGYSSAPDAPDETYILPQAPPLDMYRNASPIPSISPPRATYAPNDTEDIPPSRSPPQLIPDIYSSFPSTSTAPLHLPPLSSPPRPISFPPNLGSSSGSSVPGPYGVPSTSSILPPPPSSSQPLTPTPHSFEVPSAPPPLPLPPLATPAILPSVPAYPPTPYPKVQAPLPETISLEDTTKAKKHAKYAISALDYDDLETARRELLRALAILGFDPNALNA